MTAYSTRSCLALCAMLLLTGCGLFEKEKKSAILVPELATPREQYLFAQHLRGNIPILTQKAAPRARQLGSLKAAYQKVVDRFPDDQEYTPQARLQICDLYLNGYGRFKDALDLADALIRDYGQKDYIDAPARYFRGSALERMGRIAEAQQAYKECRDLHGASKDESVRRAALMAKERYMRVMTTDEPEKKKKKKEREIE